jgi:hypothetical protein
MKRSCVERSVSRGESCFCLCREAAMGKPALELALALALAPGCCEIGPRPRRSADANPG